MSIPYALLTRVCSADSVRSMVLCYDWRLLMLVTNCIRVGEAGAALISCVSS
jgi:hypothetical protein